MRIVILEDNKDRQATMLSCLNDRFHQHEVVFFENAREMCEFLMENLPSVLLISLDHDLELLPGADTRLVDPGTGRDVADFLAAQPPTFPIVVHTTNTAAGDGMEFLLRDAGWEVRRVHPYDDLAWIPEAWFRVVRNAIVESVRKSQKSRV